MVLGLIKSEASYWFWLPLPSVHSRVTGSAAHGLGPPESGVGGKRVLEPLEGLEVETGALEGAALYPQKSPNGAVGDVAEP